MQVTYAFPTAYADGPVGSNRWFEPIERSKGTDVMFEYDFYDPEAHGPRNDGQWFWV